MPNHACAERARPLHRARGEDGFTLLELLVAASLFLVVVAALLDPLVLSQKVQTRDANYAFAQQEARAGLDGMVSQIRQATAILASGGNLVEMNVSLNGTALHVLYECDIPQPGTTAYRECVRVQSAAGTALPSISSGTVELRNLSNGTASDPVFTFGPDPVAPYYMTATIKVPASDAVNGGLSHSIVFSDGALMRNLNVGN